MKLSKVTTFYPAFLRPWSALQGVQDYQGLTQALNETCFGWSDFWSRNLKKHGWQVQEITANAEILQRAWMEEAGQAWPEKDWQKSVAAAQVDSFQPDVLVVQDYHLFDGAWVAQRRENNKNLRLVIVTCGAPYNDTAIFKQTDLVLSCVQGMVDQFRTEGMNSHLMHHAFEPTVVERLEKQVGAAGKRDLDLTFTGNIVSANQYHLSRLKLLVSLADQLPLALYAPGRERGLGAMFKRAARVLLRRPTADPPLPKVLEQSRNPPVFGHEMYAVLRRSKLTLNCHIDIAGPWAANMRLYEATGMGACLLTDAKKNLGDLFEAGKEVVAYENSEDCVEKASWLLNHPQQMEQIAKAGQARTLKDHTWARRMEAFDALVRKALRQG